MEYMAKEKRIYNGIWIAFVVILLMPVACFFICYTQIGRYFNYPQDMLIKLCLGIAGLEGVFFCFLCTFHGFVHDIVLAWFRRVKETIQYFPPFSKDAFSWYFYNFLHDGGPIFWIFVAILIAYALTSAYGFSTFFTWYYK